MIKIQEPSKPWEIVHMDWVAGLPLGGDISYNAFQVIVERFSKTPIFLPFPKDDKYRDTALLIWNRVISWTGIFTNIISDRDPKLTSELWTNLNQLFGTNFSFSTAYHHKLVVYLKERVRCVYETVDNITINQQYYDCSYEI
ncbi:hypothetical protein O181_098363 [Austropuccinia psidii MF-1]|uniref:Integrase catalytic domain-containing protein n=1 Tax=Austropuccinia psidii MF-1 TaxID=1389203 RepID=A0A9Q3PE28_9BASI|nr:hypothetical protein [Austropuccinia psidii MF-1]